MRFLPVVLVLSLALFNSLLSYAQKLEPFDIEKEDLSNHAIDGGGGVYTKIDFAVAFLKALEKGKPEIAIEFTADKSKKMLQNLKALSKELQAVKLPDDHFPGNFFIPNKTGNNFYERLYHKREGDSRIYKLQVILDFDSTPYNMDITNIIVKKGTQVIPRSEDLKINRFCMPDKNAYYGSLDKDIYDWKTNRVNKRIELGFDMKRDVTIPDYLDKYTIPVHLEIVKPTEAEIEKFLSKEAPAVEKLIIRLDSIKAFTSKILNFKNLKTLEIYGGKYLSLPSEIGNLTKLEHLTITSPNLANIPNSIGNLVNLKSFQLNYWMGRGKYLQTYNDVSPDIPKEIGNLKKLELLRVNLGKMTALPKEIGELINLKTLEFTNGNIAIPKEIGKLSNLSTLKINETVTDIPEEIGNLKALKSLDLRLKLAQHYSLPSSIGELPNLKNILLALPNIDTLPSTIGNWVNLDSMILVCPNLKKLPETIGNLKKLRHLNIHSKKLLELPESLSTLSSLKTVVFQDVSSIPSINAPIKSVNELVIRNSELNFINKISNFSDVTIVKFVSCKIKDFSDSFRNLNKLEYLELGRCSLESLPAEVYLGKNINTLNVSANNIKEISSDILNLNTLKEILIGGNKEIYFLADGNKFPFKITKNWLYY